MPMLSNVLFSRFCGTLGPALWTILKDNKEWGEHRFRISVMGHITGLVMCVGIQIMMYFQIENNLVESQPAYVEFRLNTPVNWYFLYVAYSILAVGYLYVGKKLV